MKKLAIESSRFRTEEIPPRHRDKQHLSQLFRDLAKYFKAIGEIEIEPELHIDKVDKHWDRLMVAYQERDKHIMDEIKRLEKLQRLAEKVHRLVTFQLFLSMISNESYKIIIDILEKSNTPIPH